MAKTLIRLSALWLTYVSLALLLCVPPLRAQALYAQSLNSALARTTPGLEVLLLDLRSHEVLVNTFADPAKPIPVGSLLKPFLAMAYAKIHAEPMPTIVCHGHPDLCWRYGGQGPLTLPEAIAQSCNAYFLALARGLTPAGIASIPYLPAPPVNASAETLIGLTPDWPIAPVNLAKGYADLLAAPFSSTQTDIVAGMRASALRGTASHIGKHPGGVLAKTGTAPCIDTHCAASGDGLVVAIAPTAHPTLLLLVRKRATTGAMTAAAAGHILTQLEALHAE